MRFPTTNVKNKLRSRFRSIGKSQFLISAFGFLLILISIIQTKRNSEIDGRLSGEPTYDDITYFLDGKWRKAEFTESLGQGFSSFVWTPPHAPSLSIFSTFSQLFVGNNSDAIYFMNQILIVAMVYFFSVFIFKSKSQSILIAGLILCSPISPILYFNFRPDIHYALFLGISYAYILRDNTSQRGRAVPILTVCLFLIKPTFVAFTIFNVTCFLTWVWSTTNDRKDLLKKFFQGTVIALLLVSWFLPKGLLEIYHYVIENTLGGNKELWVSGTIMSNLFSNYGYIATMVTPAFAFFLASIFLLSLLKLYKILEFRKLAMFITFVVIVNSLIAAASRIANPFFYLTAIIPALILILNYLSLILRNKYFQWREQVVVLTIVGVLFALIPTIEWSASEIKAAGNVNQEVARIIQKENSKAITFMVAGTLNPDTLQWYLDSTRVSQNRFSSFALTIRDEKSADESLDKALKTNDMIILRNFDRSGFPSDSLQTYLDVKIRSREENLWQSVVIGDFRIWVRGK
jgi:hypothetical protein